jgi:hypothetical protein
MLKYGELRHKGGFLKQVVVANIDDLPEIVIDREIGYIDSLICSLEEYYGNLKSL